MPKSQKLTETYGIPMNNLTCKKCHKTYSNERDFLRETSGWRQSQEGTLWFKCACGETLTLAHGQYSWFNHHRQLHGEAARVFTELSSLKRIPHLSGKIFKIQELLEDPGVSNETLGAVTKEEPLIAADLLKMAQHLRRAEGQDMTSIAYAISFLGRKTFSQFLLGAALKAFQPDTQEFSAEQHWRQALMAGSIAEAITHRFGFIAIDTDELYVAASLAQIGKIIQAMVNPDKTDQLYERITTKTPIRSWELVEKELGLPNFVVLGEVGATIWGLTGRIKQAICFVHTPSAQLPKESQEFVMVASLANQLCFWHDLQPHLMNQSLLEDYRDNLGISTKDLETFMDDFTQLHT